MSTINYKNKAYSYEELHVGRLKPFECDFLDGKDDPLYKIMQWELDRINEAGEITPLHFEYASRRRAMREAGIKDGPADPIPPEPYFPDWEEYQSSLPKDDPPLGESGLEKRVGKHDDQELPRQYIDLMIKLYVASQFYKEMKRRNSRPYWNPGTCGEGEFFQEKQ